MCVVKHPGRNDWRVQVCDDPYNPHNDPRYVCAAKTLTETKPILPHCNVGFVQGSEGFCFQMFQTYEDYYPFSIQSEEENTALLHFVKQTLNDSFSIPIPFLKCYFENRTLLWFDGDKQFEVNYTNFSPLSQRCPFDDSDAFVVMDSSGQWLWSASIDWDSFTSISVNRQPVLEKFFVDSPSCEYPIHRYSGELRSTVYPNGYDINMTCAYVFYIQQWYLYIRVSVYFIDVDIADGQDFIQLIHGNGTVVTALTGREGKGRTFFLYGSESRLQFVAGQIASNATGWRAFYTFEWM